MNLTELSDDELDNLRVEVLIEQERRQTLATAPAENGARLFLKGTWAPGAGRYRADE